MTDKTWIDLFVVELRLRRVPGSAIGDAVASVRELLADSGQSAEEAFGSAREYAASLDLPVVNPRQRALQVVFLPVLGLFAFLVFAVASTAWFAGDLVLLSVPQAALLAIPVLLTVMFSFPFYPRAVFPQRWIPSALILVAGLVSAVAALFAPSTADDAWLAFSALPLLIGTMTVLVILSVVGTIATIRGDDGDEIIDPSRARQQTKPRQGRRAFLIFVNWLFPLLAIVIFAMTWGFALLRP
ncbi:hypothetical protein AB1K54_15490 [Microbacterium sp. BWT-B31]|uniref:hypothetical protein n=1 Tax=Microbacterium sp. BWT-B31 TaxID=3232072 RepID=UPI0035270A08